MRLSADGLKSLSVRDLKTCLKARDVNYRFVLSSQRFGCDWAVRFGLISIPAIKLRFDLNFKISIKKKMRCRGVWEKAELRNLFNKSSPLAVDGWCVKISEKIPPCFPPPPLSIQFEYCARVCVCMCACACV